MKILICLLFLIAFGCASESSRHGIPNFAQVDVGIYRGGEPTQEGWAYLGSVGVSNVVELNGANDAVPGFTFHRFPISFYHQFFCPPPMETIIGAEASIAPGTFVHCAHGQDRTGLVVAEYRVWRDGWSREAAREEMISHGFHRILFGLNWYWEHE